MNLQVICSYWKSYLLISFFWVNRTDPRSVFNNFIETKLIERSEIHSSNLVVNHPVGRKLASGVWPVVDSQCVPEDPEMSRQTQQVVYGPAPSSQCTTGTVQQPVDILRSGSAPLSPRYLDLSGSDIWSITQVRQSSHIARYFSPLTSRTYQSGLHRASQCFNEVSLVGLKGNAGS